ncbi:unnamed protein product [Dracunculus medinensis]|uniref:EamA domain-containing protein n=1 Tax=Dracunculus medinensis TaxID=318479 RepID=A0A0N4U9K5_DRAME|nr:unnamed protein product [Dracunculus medinensis]
MPCIFLNFFDCAMIIIVVLSFFFNFFRYLKIIEIKCYTTESGKIMLAPSILYGTCLYITLKVSHNTSLVTFHPIRSFSPVLTILLSLYVLRKKLPTRRIMFIILLICLSTSATSIIFISFNLLNFYNAWSYLFGFAVLFMQPTAFVMIEHRSKMIANYVLYINTFNSLGLFLIFDLFEVTFYI